MQPARHAAAPALRNAARATLPPDVLTLVRMVTGACRDNPVIAEEEGPDRLRSPARVAFVDDHKRCGDLDGA